MDAQYNEVPGDWQNVIVVTGSFISGFFSTRFTTIGLKNIVRYTRAFAISGNPAYMVVRHVGTTALRCDSLAPSSHAPLPTPASVTCDPNFYRFGRIKTNSLSNGS